MFRPVARSVFIPLMLFVLTLDVAGCLIAPDAGNAEDKETSRIATDPAEPTVELFGTSLRLRVIDPLGKPVVGARITLGDFHETADELGFVLFEDLKPGRVVARVEADRFTQGAFVTEISAGMRASGALTLRPLGPARRFNATAGASIITNDVELDLPPFSLVDDTGAPVTGEAEVTITPLNPTKIDDLRAMPGPLVGVRAVDGTAVPLESIFMADVSLWQSGKRLQLATGAKARLRFRVPESLYGSAPHGQQIPAWWFDTTAGVWREEGMGTVVMSSSDPRARMWSTEVAHFTHWNADFPIDQTTCLNVQVVSQYGTPVPGRSVVASDINTLTGYGGGTDSQGTICLAVKINSTVKLYVEGSNPLPNITVGGSPAACGCPDCTSVTVTVNVDCMENAWRTCPGGPQVVGECRPGSQSCFSGWWSSCYGQVQPSTEVCDKKDNDCDGSIDEDNPPGTYCMTGQYGACMWGTSSCAGGGFACIANKGPTPETCNAQDDDCNGVADEGDPGGGALCNTGLPGHCSAGSQHCLNGVLQCKPSSVSFEVCDGLDNDCNGIVDDIPGGTAGPCSTGAIGQCGSGSFVCVGGSLQCVPFQAGPEPEICNGFDDDCDGATDEGAAGEGEDCWLGNTCWWGTSVCLGGSLQCLPTSVSAEVCNGADDDCDGLTDESDPGAGAPCQTGLPGVCSNGTMQCNGVYGLICVPTVDPSSEVCDGIDNDCNGQVDDVYGVGWPCTTDALGVCSEGIYVCGAADLTCAQVTFPSLEVCDGLDNDCDGEVDEGAACGLE